MLDRSIAPAFSKTFSFDLPDPEIIKLTEDVDFVFLPGLNQDVFKLEVVFNAGKWHEPKPGLSHFTAIMLDKGTSSKSSKEIAEILDYYGAQIEITPGYDYVAVSLYGLKKYSQEIFSIFFKILIDPIFPEEEFDLQKSIFLQNLEINNKKNNVVASKLIRKNIFGPNHPYGSSLEKVNVVDLTQDELRHYFQKSFNPYEIYLIGNFDSSRTQWFVDQFSSLKAHKPATENSFAVAEGTSIDRVSKPDSVQSSIRLGKRIVNRKHPDYFELLLLNHILGGYFGSRLMKNIREEKGLTYGIYSSINPFKNDCMFSIGADVNKNNLQLTVDEIKKELEALCLHPIAKDEVDIARNHLLGSIQLEAANLFSTFDKIKSIRLNQLDKSFYANLFSSIKSIKPEDLQVIAKKYFCTNDMLEVSVG